MKLGDCAHALADATMSISRTMSNAVFLINIDSFRKLYPEYDSVADDVVAEKLRRLFYPQMDYATYAKHFLIEAKMEPTFVLVDLYLKRGDIYSKLGRQREAEAEAQGGPCLSEIRQWSVRDEERQAGPCSAIIRRR